MLITKVIDNLDKKFVSHKFSDISLNSKSCKKDSIFFALKGSKTNGNIFINDAIKNGAKTIISNFEFQGYKNNVLFLNFKNPRNALSQIASRIYKILPKNIVAVTGTNGKSSVADFYYQIFKLNNKNCASIGTLGVKSQKINISTKNTTIDIISLYKILKKLKKHKINNCILEASSHGLHQYRLHGLNIKTGIFTNISRDHFDYHKNYNNYLDSKLMLFNDIVKKNGLAIFNKELNESNKIKKICYKKKIKIQQIGKKSSIELLDIKNIKNYKKINFKYKKKVFSFKTNLIGDVQINNLMFSVLAASNHLPIKKIVKILGFIKPLNGRLEMVGKLNNEAKVILDYAHTPNALETTINCIKRQFKFSKIKILFGCGGERDKIKRPIMGRIANKLCNTIFLTDDNPRNENPELIRKQIKKFIKKDKLYEIPSRKNAIKKAILSLKSGEILIVAGKGHENYQYYKSKKFFSDKLIIRKYIKEKNKSLSFSWKTNILNEEIQNNKINKNIIISNFSTNSKKIKKNNCFIALRGKKFDGNKFADHAIQNNSIISLVEKIYGKKSKKKIKVKNTLNTFQNISKSIRKTSNLEAIGITGSSGKTSLKELLGQTLKKLNNTTYSKKSFNNKFGVPISLSQIDKNSKFGVFEIGMDRKGEIEKLSKQIQPDVGVITNISYAHIKNFKNIKGIANAKAEIIQNLNKDGIMVLNMDDKFFYYFKKIAIKNKLKVISFGRKTNADISFKTLKTNKNKIFLSIKKRNKIFTFRINKYLSNHIENLLASIAVISLYYNLDTINKNIFFNFSPPKSRGDKFILTKKNKKINIVDESYNSNPLSLNFSIQKINNLKLKNGKKYILLGDMLELGKYAKKLHISASKYINNSDIHKVYVYGKHIRHTFNKLKTKKKGKIFNKVNEIYKFINNLNNGDYLMIKGSNSTGLNKITSKLRVL